MCSVMCNYCRKECGSDYEGNNPEYVVEYLEFKSSESDYGNQIIFIKEDLYPKGKIEKIKTFIHKI